MLVKAILDRNVAHEKLEELHFRCKKENIEADKQSSEEERERTNLLIALENSRSFVQTHELIEKLSQYSVWSSEELDLLFQIAINNSQVRYIISDSDVKLFYSRLLKQAKQVTENINLVKELMENKE